MGTPDGIIISARCRKDNAAEKSIFRCRKAPCPVTFFYNDNSHIYSVYTVAFHQIGFFKPNGSRNSDPCSLLHRAVKNPKRMSALIFDVRSV